ncbi:hypothetical protein M422DRAFT_40791 [Sphaerobolus stellatus SS14]|nr:hypothetical protein M422DRAFT_40791 [Sphaerobolus stellatus SS14]
MFSRIFLFVVIGTLVLTSYIQIAVASPVPTEVASNFGSSGEIEVRICGRACMFVDGQSSDPSVSSELSDAAATASLFLIKPAASATADAAVAEATQNPTTNEPVIPQTPSVYQEDTPADVSTETASQPADISSVSTDSTPPSTDSSSVSTGSVSSLNAQSNAGVQNHISILLPSILACLSIVFIF